MLFMVYICQSAKKDFMRISAVIENTSSCGMPVEHGLSLYVQLSSCLNVLFDMGQGTLFAENAKAMGLSVADVDLAVVSHGHYDHGGGLRTFLSSNQKANVYIHKYAFLPHFSLKDFGLKYIGLDPELQTSSRITLCDSVTPIADDMMLFADVNGDFCLPVGNRLLFGPDKSVNDDFCHEQNLVVFEGEKVVLFAGCAHSGIINIMRKAESLIGRQITHAFSGMHLVKSGLTNEQEDCFIQKLAAELSSFGNCTFFTMHCTGVLQYEKLHNVLGDKIHYLSCGENVVI